MIQINSPYSHFQQLHFANGFRISPQSYRSTLNHDKVGNKTLQAPELPVSQRAAPHPQTGSLNPFLDTKDDQALEKARREVYATVATLLVRLRLLLFLLRLLEPSMLVLDLVSNLKRKIIK